MLLVQDSATLFSVDLHDSVSNRLEIVANYTSYPSASDPLYIYSTVLCVQFRSHVQLQLQVHLQGKKARHVARSTEKPLVKSFLLCCDPFSAASENTNDVYYAVRDESSVGSFTIMAVRDTGTDFAIRWKQSVEFYERTSKPCFLLCASCICMTQ
jgi:hypothetical protein